MNVSTEGTRVYVAPASFNYTNLFREATLLDTDDYDERTGGLKRPFNSRLDAEPVEPPTQGAAEYNAVEVRPYACGRLTGAKRLSGAGTSSRRAPRNVYRTERLTKGEFHPLCIL